METGERDEWNEEAEMKRRDSKRKKGAAEMRRRDRGKK